MLFVLVAIGWSATAISGGTTLHSNGLVQAEESVPDTFLARIDLDDPDAVVGALERAEHFYFKESAKSLVMPTVLSLQVVLQCLLSVNRNEVFLSFIQAPNFKPIIIYYRHKKAPFVRGLNRAVGSDTLCV